MKDGKLTALYVAARLGGAHCARGACTGCGSRSNGSTATWFGSQRHGRGRAELLR